MSFELGIKHSELTHQQITNLTHYGITNLSWLASDFLCIKRITISLNQMISY